MVKQGDEVLIIGGGGLLVVGGGRQKVEGAEDRRGRHKFPMLSEFKLCYCLMI